MNLRDIPPGLGDPVDTMLGFHRRVERQLAALSGLPCQLELAGLDAESIASATSLIEFFTRALDLHHADEDELMRLMQARVLSAHDRGLLADLCDRIDAEHHEMDRTWRALRRPLQGIAEGVNRRLPVELVQYFRASHATHISAEECQAHLAAARILDATDRAALSRGMSARRMRSYRFQ